MAINNPSNLSPLILVVDDDELFRDTLALFLEKNSYRVKQLDGCMEIVDYCAELQPDLIMMDAIMPDIDGFSACQLLKANKTTVDIPIIMVTSNNDAQSVGKAFSAGAEEYITKPIHWPVLRQRVRVYLERKKNLLALRDSEERFRLVTNSTVDAIISADENGRIIFWNKGAENIFGYQSEEIIGKPLIKLMPSRFKNEHLAGFERFIATGSSKFQGNTVELVGVRIDGTQFPLEISITSTDNHNKKYISAVLRDITERKRVLGNQEGIALFDTHIIEQIYTIWQRVGSNEAGQLSFRNLKNIMEVVFLTGIQKEEGEPVRLAVSLIKSDYFSKHGFSSDHSIIRLTKSIPFNQDSLVKLAAGFDPETTVFAICDKHNNPEILEIWGMVFTSIRGNTRLDPYPFPPEPLDVLTVSSIKAGSLSISWADQVLAKFNSGHFSEIYTGQPYVCPLSKAMFKEVQTQEEFKKGDSAYWNVYQELIKLLVGEVAKRSHGATIIWLPEKETIQSHRSLLIKHSLAQSTDILSEITNLCNLEREKGLLSEAKKTGAMDNVADGQVLEDTINECKKRLIDHIDLIAQLTCVDGALIISHRLVPLSFGSVLTAPRWKGEVQYCQPTTAGGKHLVNLSQYGTRHSSAVNFVGKHVGVIAFIVSQDGPVSCLVRQNKDVILWQSDFLSYNN